MNKKKALIDHQRSSRCFKMTAGVYMIIGNKGSILQDG